MALVEIVPGFWVVPDRVMVIRTTTTQTSGGFTFKPSVYVQVAGCNEFGWEFDTWDDARVWSTRLGNAVNAALDQQAAIARAGVVAT